MKKQELKEHFDAIREHFNATCQGGWYRCRSIAKTACAYRTETFAIRDVNCKIVIREFIASDLFYLDVIGVRYWDYLQKRKDSIVRAMGLDPINFEIC